MKNYFTKWWSFLLLFVTGFVLYVAFKPAPDIKPYTLGIDTSFKEFYQKKLSISKEKNVRKNNEEKLISYNTDKTEVAILYIHGFGACRAEGEYVTDSISKQYQANTYYLRLPGHGTNKEDHASVDFSDYIIEAEDALAMMPKIGKKTVVIGTSMGGLLATYLAAKFPDKVDALILVSPFYDYAHVAGKLVNVPGMVHLVSSLTEKGRISLPEKQIKEGYVLPEYPDYWYTEQKFEALLSLEDLKDFAANPEIYRKVTSPVLLYYFYRNEEEQDGAASVEAMLYAFNEFGKDEKPHPLNKKVNIENGDHVMFSKYVKNDKKLIFTEANDFLNKALDIER